MAASSVKVPWRNAACLMFLTGPFRYCREPQNVIKPVSITPSPFLKYHQAGQQPEPEILFVQRHSKSGFMANTHVFPGGVLDEADYSKGWLHLFTELSGSKHPFSSLTSLKLLSSYSSPSSNTSLPIYHSLPSDAPLAGQIAFRICAIREFFEEAGILLARDGGEEAGSVVDVVPGTCGPAVKELPREKMEEWRVKVHNDAYEFINMCRELNCVPDIWSLIEWSDWLTPRNHKRRYDTLFFMCCSGHKPKASPDQGEVTRAEWISPSVASRLFGEGEVMFAPPQFSEIKQLELMGDVSLIHLFALTKSVQEDGIHCKRSVRIRVKDGMLSVSERDDLFPLEGSEDWTTPVQHPQSPELRNQGVSLLLSQNTAYEYEIPTHTGEELRKLSTNTARMEFFSRSNYRFASSDDIQAFQTFLQQIAKHSSNL